MASWLSALRKTRTQVKGAFSRLLGGKGPSGGNEVEEIEAQLLGADISPSLVGQMLELLGRGTYGHPSDLSALRSMLLDFLPKDVEPFVWSKAEDPQVILMVGVNGSGKTTSAAKLAHQVKKAGLRPLLGAADTFRAAAAEQLALWADRIKCHDLVVGRSGADAAAVAYDALDAAVARSIDVAIIDTAGRMHTQQPLMDELRKIELAIKKRIPTAPHETWVVLDASIGQNAILQARYFHRSIPLTGILVTKLDGSSKAGFLFSIVKELDLPIRFVGLGEGEDDWVPFEASAFVNALVGAEEFA